MPVADAVDWRLSLAIRAVPAVLVAASLPVLVAMAGLLAAPAGGRAVTRMTAAV